MTDRLTILTTAAGAPQSPTLIRHLKENGERDVRIVAVDMDNEASGRFLADRFYRIPAAGADGYEAAILDIVRGEKPDALLNVSGNDVPLIAAMKSQIEDLGTVVVCSAAQDVDHVNNKHRLYETFRDDPDVPVPTFRHPLTLDAFVEQARGLGYPDREVCFKPHVSKGSRGFRILSERFDRRDLLLNHKPISRYMTLDDFVAIFHDAPSFPDLMLMEVVEGEEIDAMTIGYGGEALLTTCKTRESHRWGVIDKGELVERPDIERSVAAIIRRVPLTYNISIQFIGGHLIEINPRTSTFIYTAELNEPWLAVKLALGLVEPAQVRALQRKVPLGNRMVRHMDQIFFDKAGRSWR